MKNASAISKNLHFSVIFSQKSHKNMKMPLLKAILCVEEYRFEKAFLSDFAFEVQMLPKSNCI